jgi:hypothetical protein
MSITIFKALIPGKKCRGSHINASFEAMKIYNCAKRPVSVVTVWFCDPCETVRSGKVDPLLTYLKIRLFKHVNTQNDR